jgi:DNA-binding response OmpR family regulator
MSKLILVVEDEPNIAEICRDYLTRAGFRVITAGDGPRGLALARREQPDMVVLDLMLPGMDGLDVCRELRRETEVPIIMLTARIDERDRLIGLELGADDYLSKPFSPRELVARVRAVLRRTVATETKPIVRALDLSLDRGRYRAILPDREVPLTPTEFEILVTLASQPGRVFSREQLLQAARGVSFESYERAVDSHIRNIRKKIEPAGADPRYVITVHGVGYKFGE